MANAFIVDAIQGRAAALKDDIRGLEDRMKDWGERIAELQSKSAIAQVDLQACEEFLRDYAGGDS